jgi:predicted amidohydrolase YtcJ
MPHILLSAMLIALFNMACTSTGQDRASHSADLLLINGRVYTMNAQRDWAEALAIRDGRIIFVGSNEGAAAYEEGARELVDLKGKLVLPSFQDVHIHPVSGGVAYTGCTLFDTETLQQVLDKLRECVQEDPHAKYIRGQGWSWSVFIDQGPPHKRMLDAIESERPVVLGDADGHTLWLNSPALDLAGVTADTPDPEGGEIGREVGSREPSGTLLEGPAMDLINAKLPAPTAEQKEAGLRYTQSYLNKLGITAIQDAYVRLRGNEADRSLETYVTLRDNGDLNLRVVAALYWEPGEGLDQIDAMREARDRYSGGRVQATAVKIWADGILETHTAMLLEPYTDQPDNSGLLMVSRDEMIQAVPMLDAAGFQVHIHAIGDATVRYALDSFEKALRTNGKRDSRHLTAHTQLVSLEDIGRFGELDAIAGFSPYWAYADSYVAEINPPQLGAARIQQMYPIKSILDSGGRVAFGSDWSVSTADPLLGIETAMTRIEPDGPATPVFLPEQRIDLPQAIAGYTIDAAYANFLDADTGSLELGKYGDLIVLSENLFEIPTERISEATVEATLLEGEWVYGEF